MYSRIPVLALISVLTLPGWSQPIRAELDGRALQFDQPPIMQGGRVMVPLRGIFEALGAEVRFESATQRILANKGSQSVELRLGSTQATVNGQSVTLDSPAGSIGGRTMVPLRFVSEALGADVRWMSANQTVYLSSGGAIPPDQPDQPSAPTVELRSVAHNARQPLGPGERLVVTATGTPGGQASFEILGVSRNEPMRETQPGQYRGSYTVPNRLRSQRGTLVVHLTSGGDSAQLEADREVRFENSASPNPSGGNLRIDRVNLRNGQRVGPVFQVSGQCAPGSQISLTASAPGINLRFQGQANQAGQFLIPVNATNALNNTRLTLQMHARSGRQRGPVTSVQVLVVR